MNRLLNRLSEEQISCVEHCPISKYSTFRIGGTARLAVFPKSREQMIRTLQLVGEADVSYAVVGKGSTLLFPDGEYGGVLIFTTRFDGIQCVGDGLTVLAGTSLAAVAIRAEGLSLGGAEFAAGIPGTVGGAVLMNAGAFGGCMEQIVTYVECWNMQMKRVERFDKGDHRFAYRTSRYAENRGVVILEVGLELQPRDRKTIDGLMAEYRRRRQASQPLEYPNGGSVFKNPDGYSAGKLIEDCGLKGASVGGACVSEKHANFIVNKGGATAHNVADLIGIVRQKVLEQTGIRLTCELRGLGFSL